MTRDTKINSSTSEYRRKERERGLRNVLSAAVAALLLMPPLLQLKAATLSVETVLTWEECAALALKNHPDIVSAGEKVKQAKSNEGITRSSLLPQVSASMDIYRSRQDYTGTLQGNREDTTYSYGISGRQLLFDGGKVLLDTAAAKKLAEQAVYEKMVISSEVRLNLKTAFVSLLKAQEYMRIAEAIVERRKKSLDLVLMRYNAGREHRGSLLTAEVNLAQAEADYAQAKRGVTLARHRLVKEMGLKEWDRFTVRGEMLPPVTGAATPPYGHLADATPQVKKAEMQKEYAEYARMSSKSDYLPQLYGTASAGKNDTSWPPQNTQWSVGVELTLPLLQGGKRVYQNSKADAEYRQAVADLKSTRSSMTVGIEEHWVALLNAVDTFRVKEKALRAAEERARIAEAQYSIGQILFDNWIIIENELVQAKKSYLEAQADMLIAEAAWNKSKGVTLEHDR